MSQRRKKPRGTKNRKRSARPKKDNAPAVTIDIEETTGAGGAGVTVLEPKAVPKMREIIEYLEAGILSADQVEGIYKRMGKIAALGDDRYAIPAFRVMLAAAKLNNDLSNPKQPTNVNINTDGGRVDVFGIAQQLGIAIDVTDGVEPPSVINGTSQDAPSDDPLE